MSAPGSPRRVGRLLATGVLAAAVFASRPQGPTRWREDFSQPSRWQAIPAGGVKLALTTDPEAAALRLDFDFQGHGGWAAARRQLDLGLPENWELRFRVQGPAPRNHLEIKLVDPSGENVWWSVRRDFSVSAEWTMVRVKKRQLSFAWGPAGGGEIRHLGALELAVTAGEGGRGTLRVADLELVALAPERPYAGRPWATASPEEPAASAALAVDSRRETSWRAPPGVSRLEVDFGEPRELGGLTLYWERGRAPRRMAVDLAQEIGVWQEVRRIDHGGGERTDLMLPEAEGRAVRLRVIEAPTGVALSELVVRPLGFGASPNAFFEAVAAESPRGAYPRGFSGQQAFWTVAGVDGDTEEALVSEDGAVDLGEGAPSLEPFLWVDGRLWSWADVTASQALVDGDLPIPIVSWELPDLRLDTTVLAAGPQGRSLLLIRYRLLNAGAARRAARLFLAARPFQVNPPSQFLNRPGGIATIGAIRCEGGGLQLDRRRLAVAPAASACGTAAFDEGPLVGWLAGGELPASARVEDPFPYASGALAWDFDLAPGEERSVVVATPFHPEALPEVIRLTAAGGAPARFAARLAEERAGWRQKLDRVRLELPPEAAPLAATLRSSLGFILVHRDGPALQPGSRAYARSWIRDGALTSTALLRLGHPEVAAAFAEWFAGFQYPDGRVPCCVDGRGADPVAEHDAHGEFIHLTAEIVRFTGDRGFATRLLPHVEAAAAAIDALRGQRRTAAFRQPGQLAFFGLLPESISHEGYSSKPRHSYWDTGFAWRGLADAAWLAGWLGRDDLAGRFAAARDELGVDLRASIERVRATHGIDYLPGCAELGDFDSTATTAMLDPVGLDALLPWGAFLATFERYHQEFRARRDGRRAWDVYTPYEVRHVGSFVRMGQRERAHELLAAFLADRRPLAWNQFPEVVTRELRQPRFLGDLPHGWVASDFARSVLDLFAYERRADGALVLAAGIPSAWLVAGQRISISGLGTPFGPLAYEIRVERRRLMVRIAALPRPPPGGVVLALPIPETGGRARIGGRQTILAAGSTLTIATLPAVVEVEARFDHSKDEP